MNWIDILKSDQISVGSTTLDTRELPEENNNCCEEAKMKYNEVLISIERKYKNLNLQSRLIRHGEHRYTSSSTAADKLDCDKFKSHLKRTPSYKKGDYIREIVDEWEACENA